MIIKHYDELMREEAYWKFTKQTEGLMPKLISEFDKFYYNGGADKRVKSSIKNVLLRNLPCILTILNGDLAGKIILDLGCGSDFSTDGFGYGGTLIYSPWLCRTLNKLGAKPIGVDLDLRNEEFEHHSVNLLEESLDFLPDHSVDVANACALFDSPTLLFMIGKIPRAGFNEFEDRIRKQLERIVKPEGYFIHNNV